MISLAVPEIGMGRLARMSVIKPDVSAARTLDYSINRVKWTDKPFLKTRMYRELRLRGIAWADPRQTEYDILNVPELKGFLTQMESKDFARLGLKTRSADYSDAFEAIVGRAAPYTTTESRYGKDHEDVRIAIEALFSGDIPTWNILKEELDAKGIRIDLSGAVFAPSPLRTPLNKYCLTVPAALTALSIGALCLNDPGSFLKTFGLINLVGAVGGFYALVSTPGPHYINVNLKQTDLTKARFGYSLFTGTNLDGAILTGIDTRWTEGLDQSGY
jgi:hypothetical protein